MNNLVISNPEVFLSELLPYDTSIKIKGHLRTSLQEYSFLLTALEKAVTALKNGDLEQFDALVGENACQIRAVKIAMTAHKCFAPLEAFHAGISNSKLKIKALSSSLPSLIKQRVSLQDLIKREEMDIALTKNELFLVESFILSIAKTTNPPKLPYPLCINHVTDLKKLIELGPNVSASFLGALVKRTKQLLSAASVAFVQEQAQLLNDLELEKKCSNEFVIDHENKLCLPMFWTCKTVLLAAQKENIPLVIHAKFLAKDREYATVDEEWILFQSDLSPQNTYEESVPYACDLAKAAIVFEGAVCADADLLISKSEWRRTLTAQKLDVILAGAADHRQYPNPGEDRRIEELNDTEFEGYKAMARSQGYSLENPSVFFIQHVYSATIGSMPDLVRQALLAGEVVPHTLDLKYY